MLNERLRSHIEPGLRSGESIDVAMAGFRPISKSAALVAVFVFVFGGFAVATAAGLPSWVGGAVGGGSGALAAALLDQRRARKEHQGKGMSVGLVVTTYRLFVLDLDTGLLSAHVAGVAVEAERSAIASVETERMQGSGLKRLGVVISLRDGTVTHVIPARTDPFVRSLSD